MVHFISLLHPVLISLACVAYVEHIEYMYSAMTLDKRRNGILKCNGRACTYNEKFIFYDVKLFSKPSWWASPLDPENRCHIGIGKKVKKLSQKGTFTHQVGYQIYFYLSVVYVLSFAVEKSLVHYLEINVNHYFCLSEVTASNIIPA